MEDTGVVRRAVGAKSGRSTDMQNGSGYANKEHKKLRSMSGISVNSTSGEGNVERVVDTHERDLRFEFGSFVDDLVLAFDVEDALSSAPVCKLQRCTDPHKAKHGNEDIINLDNVKEGYFLPEAYRVLYAPGLYAKLPAVFSNTKLRNQQDRPKFGTNTGTVIPNTDKGEGTEGVAILSGLPVTPPNSRGRDTIIGNEVSRISRDVCDSNNTTGKMVADVGEYDTVTGSGHTNSNNSLGGQGLASTGGTTSANYGTPLKLQNWEDRANNNIGLGDGVERHYTDECSARTAAEQVSSVIAHRGNRGGCSEARRSLTEEFMKVDPLIVLSSSTRSTSTTNHSSNGGYTTADHVDQHTKRFERTVLPYGLTFSHIDGVRSLVKANSATEFGTSTYAGGMSIFSGGMNSSKNYTVLDKDAPLTVDGEMPEIQTISSFKVPVEDDVPTSSNAAVDAGTGTGSGLDTNGVGINENGRDVEIENAVDAKGRGVVGFTSRLLGKELSNELMAVIKLWCSGRSAEGDVGGSRHYVDDHNSTPLGRSSLRRGVTVISNGNLDIDGFVKRIIAMANVKKNDKHQLDTAPVRNTDVSNGVASEEHTESEIDTDGPPHEQQYTLDTLGRDNNSSRDDTPAINTGLTGMPNGAAFLNLNTGSATHDVST
eukprot:Lankesteria_metandrocarpae@DN3258_c1_g1_i1.p1